MLAFLILNSLRQLGLDPTVLETSRIMPKGWEIKLGASAISQLLLYFFRIRGLARVPLSFLNSMVPVVVTVFLPWPLQELDSQIWEVVECRFELGSASCPLSNNPGQGI